MPAPGRRPGALTLLAVSSVALSSCAATLPATPASGTADPAIRGVVQRTEQPVTFAARPAPSRPAAKAAAVRGDQRPNVLMVTVDDASPTNLRYMPNVRRLVAQRGVTLTNGVAPTAICVPARASLLTGQYAHNHGARAISGPHAGFKDFADDETLPVWLQRAGYDTMFIGKYLNGYGDTPQTQRYVPPGWTDWRGTVGSSTTNYTGPVINHNGRVFKVGRYNSDLFSDYTVEQLRERRRTQRPWFMMVNYVAPHAGGPKDTDDPRDGWPLGTPNVAPRHEGRFAGLRLPATPNMFEADTADKADASQTKRHTPAKQRRFARIDHQQRVESLLAVDEAVAKAVRTLRETRQLGRTVIMFSSDNGYLLGQHNRFAKPRPYEESQKVPMVLAGPGIPKGKRVATQVTNPDLATTVAALAGARPRLPQDGVNILPLLRHRTVERVVPIQAWSHKDGSEETYRGVRTRNWTYVRFPNGEEELYDHRRDPYQLNSQAENPDHLLVLTQMREYTDQYIDCAGATCPRPQLG